MFHIPGPETSHKGGRFLEEETKGQENGVQDRQGWGEEKSQVKVRLGEEGQRKGERTNKKQRTKQGGLQREAVSKTNPTKS